MKTVAIPWGAWHRKTPIRLSFPANWDVETAAMKDAPHMSDRQIGAAFENPIGSSCIADMARGRKSAIITVDDLTRPTEAFRFIPHIISELRAGGMEDHAISFLMAVGAHRALARQDTIKKLGREIVSRYPVFNHSPFDDLVAVGTSLSGVPISVNRRFMEAELKIAVGFICPHPNAGWGGGGKIVMPGVCGIETLAAVHAASAKDAPESIVGRSDNTLRDEINDIAARVHLDVIVNSVGTADGGTAGLFVGDFLEAHRAGIRLAREVYATDVPPGIDVGIFNAFPEDNEFMQCEKALNIWSNAEADLLKSNGTIVIATAASEGRGVHYLFDEGMRLYKKPATRPAWLRKVEGRRLLFFCPNVTSSEAETDYPGNARVFNRWNPLLKELQIRHREGTHAVVFPCCSLQFSRRERRQ